MISPPQSDKFLSVSAYTSVSCGLRTDETLACWGRETSDVLDVPEGEFTEVQVGASFACAIRKDDQRVICWGRDSYGQLDVPLDESAN